LVIGWRIIIIKRSTNTAPVIIMMIRPSSVLAIPISVANGKTLKIKVENQSPENVQVKEVRLNWKVLETPFVKFSELIGGGEMVLKMKKN
jgi:putative alpha-1,2-mannosidase